ncbi:Hypothetical_protein [Hexamita inflata]|uniref:Hypothetical_protein n=1 Tax=Hexamita inflata TaxID=28002 RepID=A0AA86UR17_9EUKA|nr:Hypothetical protein HINF_LOCUS52304 [Hexamita inflata]
MINIYLFVLLSANINSDDILADIILINQEYQNITLKAATTIIVGVKVPPAVIANGQTVAYSQFAFEAQADVDYQNYIFYNSLDNNTNHAIQQYYDQFASFAVLLSKQQNEKQEYVYINVTSTCNTEMRLVASAVHQFDSQTYSLSKVFPESTFFVHKQVPGVNKRVKFEIDTQEMFIVYVCSAPNLMNIIWFNCGYIRSNGQKFMEIDVDIKNYNYYKNYIYYTLQYKNDNNKLIKADIVDVYEIGVDSHHDIQIQASTPLHYQFADDLPKDAYFEVLSIGPGVELCFTETFEYPENVKCKVSLNQTGKFNITETNFLVQSQGAGRLAFEVNVWGSEKKENNQWIVWVVVAGVVVAVGIVVFVFFFMRHKKQMDKQKSQNDETEILLMKSDTN